jgi:hypothetical protein
MLRALILSCAILLTLGTQAVAAPGWLPPQPLTAGAFWHVSMNGPGEVVVVWRRADDGAVRVATRRPNAAWEYSAPLSTPGRTVTEAVAGISDGGDILVAWTEETPSGAIVRASTRAPAGAFTTARDLSLAGTPASPRSASNVLVLMAADGGADVLWQRFNGTAIVVQAVSRDRPNEAFALPEQLSATAAGDVNSLQAGMDAGGTALAVWGDTGLSSATRPRGGAWSAPLPIPGVTAANFPVLAVSHDGAALVAFGGGISSHEYAATPRIGSAPWTTGSLGWLGYSGRLRIAFDADGTLVINTQMEAANTPTTFLGTRSPAGVVSIGPFSADGTLSAPRGMATSRTGGVLAYWSTRRGIFSAVRPTGGPFGPEQRITAGVWGESMPVRVVRDDEGNGVAVWANGDELWTAGFDAAAPSIDAVEIPASALVGTVVPMRVTVRDRASHVAVTWQLGDGATATGPAVEHVFADTGAKGITITARDALGNERRITRTIDIVAPEQPPVVGVPGDGDGDGFPASQDCDDTNPAIRPGSPEIVGNQVDENCDGRIAPFPTVAATALLTTQFLGDRSTLLLRLRVRDLAAGDTIRLRCRGRGCRRAMNRTVKVKKASKTLELTRHIRRVRLRPGSRVDITISHPGQTSRIFSFVTRSSGTGAPRVQRRCRPPGGTERTC